MPLLTPEALAILGARDGAEIEETGVASLDGTAALFLDVLATSELAAVDYPQPGGLSWEELLEIGGAALGDTGCAGVSIAIYNPSLDPDRVGAERVVDFSERLVTTPGSRT